MRLSTRNQLSGTVLSVARGEAMAVVKVQLAGSEVVMTSAITAESAQELGIEAGKDVMLLVKSTEVAIGVE